MKKLLSKLVFALGLGVIAVFAIPAALCLIPAIALWRGMDKLLGYLDE